jgi:predicted TIM-barrel fold metal-dependent hydrolase
MKDKVPQSKELDGTNTWHVDGQPLQRGGVAFRAGRPRDHKALEALRATSRFQVRWGDWDPVERLKDYDIDGVDAAVLFPNFSGFTGNPLAIVKDLDVRLECIRAYNDWLVDEFCATDPKRLIALPLIPAWDVELAINEAVRAVKKGHRGVMFGAALDVFGFTPNWDRYWDPFYATVEDLGVPLTFHQISATMDRAVFHDPNVDVPLYIRTATTIAHIHSLIMPTTELIMSGILERFPRLRVFYAEGGVCWLPYTLNQLDFFWPIHGRTDGNELRMLPSDYWRRQCAAGFWSDPVTPDVVEWVGADNVLWEGDYLHTIATYPQSQKVIEKSLVKIQDENLRQKILSGNSVKLFGLNS